MKARARWCRRSHARLLWRDAAAAEQQQNNTLDRDFLPKKKCWLAPDLIQARPARQLGARDAGFWGSPQNSHLRPASKRWMGVQSAGGPSGPWPSHLHLGSQELRLGRIVRHRIAVGRSAPHRRHVRSRHFRHPPRGGVSSTTFPRRLLLSNFSPMKHATIC